MADTAMSTAPALALTAPRELVDALPYVDAQYNDAALKAKVDAAIKDEMERMDASEYTRRFTPWEPNFKGHPMLEAEWFRVCEEQPMPQMDTSRYQMDPPPPKQHSNPAAWARAVGNAQAQLEHQANRLDNLELLQKFGANQWRIHLNSLEAANSRLAEEQAVLVTEIADVNRKRKLEQVEVGPKLSQLEADWVSTVKKNLEIEGQVARLDMECAAYRQQLDPTVH
uniref:Pre-mRNA-splicing factor SPF27 n=1 Tax=Coccolithus braarudii TaxID=221442 RepID=A0A7S0L8W3_9EUKA|mmetsp:Transcript_24506/g.52850  ORF Transcript_24506/g.52850 Transcript_24506/m.52850 type:complete len:226 (+) Transcript_24506:104-781(+)